MQIHQYYYDQDTRSLYVEFSIKQDKDKYYRKLDIMYSDIEYYSTTIITESDMEDIDEDFIIEFLEQYFKENELPEQELL